MQLRDDENTQPGAKERARFELSHRDADAASTIHSQSGNGATPAVAIVIAAHDAADTIEETLAGFVRQTRPCPEFELVVIDDHSPDATAKVAAEYLRGHDEITARVVRSSANLGVSRARAIGVRKTSAPFVLFFDADDQPNASYVAGHMNTLTTQPEPAASYAVLTPEAFGQDDEVRVGLETLQDDGPNSVFNIILWVGAGSLGVPRPLFDQLGGFDSEMIGAEDIEFCIRMWQAGAPLLLAPGAICRIRTRTSPGDVFRQRKAYAVAHVAIARAHWSMQDPIRFIAAQLKAMSRIPGVLFRAARAFVAGGPARFEAADTVGSLVGYVVGSVKYRRPVLTIWGNSLRR